MKSTTATNLRKDLFSVIEKASQLVPTRIRYRKGDAVILSYKQYSALKERKPHPARGSRTLNPLVKGRIIGKLNEKSDKAVMKYMRIGSK